MYNRTVHSMNIILKRNGDMISLEAVNISVRKLRALLAGASVKALRKRIGECFAEVALGHAALVKTGFEEVALKKH